MLLACALVGCDRGGQAKLEQTAKSIESWSATLHETAQQWRRGSVPRIYVRQIAKAAEEELATESKDLEKAPVARSVLMGVIGLIAAVWALASLLS